MSTLIFAAGIALGALVTFVFVFIMVTVGSKNNKKDTSKINDDLIRELWHEYIKEMRDDGK